MLIPIPIGARYVAAVQGAVWKFISCTRCQQRYAYLLELEATGEDHDLFFLDGEGSAQRAQAQAEEHLLQKSRNCVLPVPCPHCGFYQEEMSRRLKEEAWTNPVQYAGVLIVFLSPLPLVFNVAYSWILTVVLVVAGLTVMTYGYALSYGFDPNGGDPEPRKALGQRHAVWGTQLAELLATNPNATDCAAADRPHEYGPSSDHVKPA